MYYMTSYENFMEKLFEKYLIGKTGITYRSEQDCTQYLLSLHKDHILDKVPLD